MEGSEDSTVIYITTNMNNSFEGYTNISGIVNS